MTPGPLLAARVRPMCQSTGSRGHCDLGNYLQLRMDRLGIWEGIWKFPQKESSEASPTRRRRLGTPRGSPAARAGVRASACADISLRRSCRTAFRSRCARPKPRVGPGRPQLHASGHAEQHTVPPRRVREGRAKGRGRAAGRAAHWSRAAGAEQALAGRGRQRTGAGAEVGLGARGRPGQVDAG